MDHLSSIITLAAAPERRTWKCNRYKRTLESYLCSSPSPSHSKCQNLLPSRGTSISETPDTLAFSPRNTCRYFSGFARVERVVVKLDFQAGTLAELWGNGLTPQEWRFFDVVNRISLRIALISILELLGTISTLATTKKGLFVSLISLHRATGGQQRRSEKIHRAPVPLNEHTPDAHLE